MSIGWLFATWAAWFGAMCLCGWLATRYENRRGDRMLAEDKIT